MSIIAEAARWAAFCVSGLVGRGPSAWAGRKGGVVVNGRLKHVVDGSVVSAVVAALGALVGAQAPTAPAATLPAAVEQHIAAAKAAAGQEHAGVFDAVCGTARQVLAQASAPPRAGGPGRGARGGGPPAPPARDTWHAEPVKVFDNLYFVGQTEFSAWAITTSQGIILLDAIFDYSVEDEVVGGLKKLGLDPAQIKYVIVSHGHLDHAGGAKLLQERFASRLIMTAADYDLLDQQNPPWKPKRDIVATDGYKLTLGDTTLTLYVTPGHTEGTISTIIPLKDGGRSHVAAAWGGTLFNFGPIKPRLQAYAASAQRFTDIAAKAGADVMLSNHTVYDGSKAKLPAMATRKPGDRHPYVGGAASVQAYLTTVGECAQAAIAGLP
jgi:metallo-beta-lactamase class B